MSSTLWKVYVSKTGPYQEYMLSEKDGIFVQSENESHGYYIVSATDSTIKKLDDEWVVRVEKMSTAGYVLTSE